jgi:alpha-tubulin suppressor-like RCC1 family protein
MLLIIVIGLVFTMITFVAVYIVLYKKQQTMFEERDAMLKEYSENIDRNRELQDDQYSKTKKTRHVLHKNAHQMYDRNIQDVQNLGIIANAELIDLNDHTSSQFDSLVKMNRVSKKRDQIFKQKYASINDTIINADNIKRGLDLSIHQINANIERINYNHNIIETNMQTISNQLSSNKATMKQVDDAVVELDSTISSLYNSLKTQKDRLNELEDVLFEFKSQEQVEPSHVEAIDMKLEETRKANMVLQTQLKNIESVITSTLTGTQIADLSTKLIDVSKKVTTISTELERTAKKLCIGDTCIPEETLKQLMNIQTAAAERARQAALAEQQRQAALVAEQQRQAALVAEQQRQAALAAEQQRQAALAAEQQRQARLAQEAAAAAERARQATQVIVVAKIGICSVSRHNVHMNTAGRIWSYGSNDSGELGNGTTRPNGTAPPTDITISGSLNGKTIVSIALGNGHTIALDSTGKVHAWGNNSTGQIGNGTTTNISTPISVSSFGTLNGKTIVSIACGSSRTFAIDSNGQVHAWGDNRYGQLGNNSRSPITIPINISSFGSLVGKTIVSISSAHDHTAAIDSNGNVHTFGYNWIGQLGNGVSGASGGEALVTIPINISTSGSLSGRTIVSIVTGSDFTLALDSTGNIHGWGDNYYGQLGNGTTSGMGNGIATPRIVSGFGSTNGKKIVSIHSGYLHAFAIDSARNVHAWGHNSKGQLGNGTKSSSSSTPINISSFGSLNGKTIVSITGGQLDTIALDSKGNVHTWGGNYYGQLGNNSSTDNPIPTQVSTPASVSSTDVRESDGKVWAYKGCWNDFAYKGLPRPLEDTVGRLDGTDAEIRQKCAKHARSSGRNIFAIQDNNQCMIGNTSRHNYARDGISSGCNGMKGGPWLNSVWVLE